MYTCWLRRFAGDLGNGQGRGKAECPLCLTNNPTTKLCKTTILPRFKGQHISLLSSVSLIRSTVYRLACQYWEQNLTRKLTFWRRNYSFNFSTPCTQNVNITGTKHVRIIKQTPFWRGRKTESIYHVKIFSTYICWINK